MNRRSDKYNTPSYVLKQFRKGFEDYEEEPAPKPKPKRRKKVVIKVFSGGLPGTKRK